MSDDELLAYRFLVATGEATAERLSTSLGWGTGQAQEALSGLRRLRLARTATERGGAWTAVHPETVKRQYAKPLSGVIDAWQQQLDGFREQLRALSGLGAEGMDGGGLSPVVTVEGVSDIQSLLADCVARCTKELTAVQPLGRGAPALAREVVRRDAPAMNPAVSVRVLLPHLSRCDAEVRDCVERLLEAGGEARTSAATLPAMIIFDRSVAFLLDGQDTAKAHMVKHSALVDFIVHMVVSAWATSRIFQPTGGNNRIPESLTRETKTAILQLLAAGYKDEVVARRLGIGVRTCRKYIAEMFGDLGAQSRFQAGWMARDHMLVSTRERAAGDRDAMEAPNAPRPPRGSLTGPHG